MHQTAHPDGAAITPPTLLLISGERVGAALVAASLRARGHRVVVADTAAQAVSRLTDGPTQVGALVIVGSLRDATPEALRRWVDRHGLEHLPIAAIGSDRPADAVDGPGEILAMVAEDWPRRAEEFSEWLTTRAELPERAAS